MSEFNQARREGKVKFGYDFSDLAEVTHLWGLSATKLPYRNYFKIPGRENAICLLLSEDGGEGWRNIPYRGLKMDGRGWSEIVRIDEDNSDSEKSEQRVNDELSQPLERYVFWREIRNGVRWYKFYGVFKLDVAETQASKEAGKNVCIYRKVSDEGTCPKCDVETRTISIDEFLSAKDKILIATLLSTVHYDHEGVGKNDDVKVWPGQKFLVKSVSSATQMAICKAVDGNALKQIGSADVPFVISKRDVELGYFRILDGKGTPEDMSIRDARDRQTGSQEI